MHVGMARSGAMIPWRWMASAVAVGVCVGWFVRSSLVVVNMEERAIAAVINSPLGLDLSYDLGLYAYNRGDMKNAEILLSHVCESSTAYPIACLVMKKIITRRAGIPR